MELSGWGTENLVKTGSCLAKICGPEFHICAGLDCVKTLARQLNE